jgi:hypothetical protein
MLYLPLLLLLLPSVVLSSDGIHVLFLGVDVRESVDGRRYGFR